MASLPKETRRFNVCNGKTSNIIILALENECIIYELLLQVKLNLSLLEDIKDDMEFSLKLAKEESVIVLPGKMYKYLNFVLA